MEAIYLFLPLLIYMWFTTIERDSCPKMHFLSVTSTSNSRTHLPDGKNQQQMPVFSKMPQSPTYIHILPGKFLLADAGYRLSPNLLVPYWSVHYHLAKWGHASVQ